MEKNKEQNMAENIKSVCNSLVESFHNDLVENYNEFTDEIIKKHKSDLKKPYDLYVVHTAKQTEYLPVLIEKIYSLPNGKNVFFINFIYENCLLIKKHIENMVDCHDGGICDKATWLMEEYINFKVTGKVFQFEEERKWSHPDFGYFEQWIKYIEDTILFLSGHLSLNRYTETVNVLQAQKDKYLKIKEEERKKLFDFLPQYIEYIQLMLNEFKISDEQYETLTGPFKFSILYHCKGIIFVKEHMKDVDFYNALYSRIVDYLNNYEF